ncbi:DUF4345 domain-containing protein [Shewanella sp. 1CM18E]|uniref:DUF4345 domain-containing protein n=1 Tax=Shewanella sp. 1CM18E TaxID=2929169 RepID=UPI0020BE8911|nr:DUF4345 domain-containing protein [Shewanella sp. 1CM18E]MCK8045161.1 DUF4345 domain-containing protein [Shewanella sp. 1CM18E]
MRIQQQFLLVAAVGLTPIALGYGLQPSTSLAFLFDIDASSINSSHIFRAVMGLYLALVLFWGLGAFIRKYQLPALYSLTVFMFGLAFGRALSLIVDGWPHWLLVVYLLLEVGFGLVGIAMIRKTEKEG